MTARVSQQSESATTNKLVLEVPRRSPRQTSHN